MLARIIVLILTFYLLPSIAQEATPSPESEELRRIAECGMDEGKVIPLDGTLCRDDIAFGMMYDFFPSVYNELIPFWGLSMFSALGDSPNVPESAGQYNGEDVMMVLYEMLYDWYRYARHYLKALLDDDLMLKAAKEAQKELKLKPKERIKLTGGYYLLLCAQP